jgi:hypothetical protein
MDAIRQQTDYWRQVKTGIKTATAAVLLAAQLFLSPVAADELQNNHSHSNGNNSIPSTSEKASSIDEFCLTLEQELKGSDFRIVKNYQFPDGQIADVMIIGHDINDKNITWRVYEIDPSNGIFKNKQYESITRYFSFTESPEFEAHKKKVLNEMTCLKNEYAEFLRKQMLNKDITEYLTPLKNEGTIQDFYNSDILDRSQKQKKVIGKRGNLDICVELATGIFGIEFDEKEKYKWQRANIPVVYIKDFGEKEKKEIQRQIKLGGWKPYEWQDN